MALLVVQLAHFVLYNLPEIETAVYAYNIFIGINEMFNVIIIYNICSFLILLFTDKHYYLIGHHTNNNFVACLIEIVLR